MKNSYFKDFKHNNFYSPDFILKLLFWYRITLCFLMEFFIQNITRRGDTLDYLNANAFEVIKDQGINAFINGTHFTEMFIGAVSSVINDYLITNILFTILAYLGIRAFLKAVPCKNDIHYKILLFLCFLPTFNLWSSVAGKEALAVFAIGIVSAEIVRFFNGEKVKTGFLFFISLYLIIIIKQQYLPAVVQVLLYIVIRQRIKISGKLDVIFLSSLLAANILFIYFARDFFIWYSFNIHRYFRLDGRSTRERFFYEQYDFFIKMPYLMPLAMWGPTLKETAVTKLHLLAFIESFFLFTGLIYLLKDFVLLLIKDFKKYYQSFIIYIIGTFWLFMAQYIQGIMNPGAAIRYRTNLYLMMIALCISPFIVKNSDGRNNSVDLK